ncbi:MAG: hypothetical protein H7061_12255 [Bdellovibrionaceae bacterium]|nr:hypothetical protein [Bdellovibrio sp.]
MGDITKNSFKRPIALAALLILLAVGIFNKDSIIEFFSQNNNGIKLANVKNVKNEVRRKKTTSLSWNAAAKDDSIHRGDSVSTGQSSTALVEFLNGQQLTLDQNTLIVFDQQADTPEFVSGNIKLTVNGSMKIKIDNEIITIDGQNADIQVFKDTKKNKQKIVLLKGQSSVTSAKNKVKLERNKVVEAKEVVLRPEEFKAVVAQENKIERALAEKVQAKQLITEPAVKAAPPGAAPPAPSQIVFYKLYDFYKRIDQKGLDFNLNPQFKEKPNAQFEAFTPATISFKSKIELKDNLTTPGQFFISDTAKVMGYVVEVSQNNSFPAMATKYFWARSQFSYPFSNPGTYFFRYRKVLPEMRLSGYSPQEPMTILPKAVELKMAEAKQKKIKRIKKIVEIEKPVVVAIAPPIKKEIIQLVPTQRKPAAIAPAQSALKLAPQRILNNQKFTESYVDVHATQGFLASNRQIENSHAYSQNYNLGFDITHWSYNHGVEAEVNKTMTSTEAANSILMAQVNYMYRLFVKSQLADGDRIQFALIAGYEIYQNSNATTADYLTSYNLFKIGLGASLPLFSFWNFEFQTFYGIGTGAKSLQLAARMNYFIRKNLSLGLGFRARKYDFVLSNKQNMESLSETFTSIRYYY